MPLASIVAFIVKWSVGVAVMTCDIIFDVTVSILVLLEMIVIEIFSIMCVLVIDVWKSDEIVDPGTPTRGNNMADVETKEDNDTASSTSSSDTNRTTETGSGSDELRMSYRHLKQEYKKKRKMSRTHSEEIVGSEVVF